jgi:predicted RNA-binding protein with PUA-like domain
MPKRQWLVKQEPADFPWSALVRDNGTEWTGVRNFQARNNLRAMQLGDHVLYYHSGEERQIMGLATVSRTAYPDPTAPDGDWSAVDIQPVQPFPTPVSLARIKAAPRLKNFALLRQSRLSVVPVSAEEFRCLVEMGRNTPHRSSSLEKREP